MDPKGRAIAFLSVVVLLLPGFTRSGLGEERPEVDGETGFQPGRTFQQTYDEAIQAFKEGFYPEANLLFNQMQDTFGLEPEFNEATVQKHILPLAGYSAFYTGDNSRAVKSFRAYLDRFMEDPETRAFTLYSLAEVYRRTGVHQKAISTFLQFEKEFPGRSETALARLHRSDLYLKSGDIEQSLSVLFQIYQSEYPYSLRIQARTKALKILVDASRVEESFEVLDHTRWSTQTMPELAVLTLSALRLGDTYLSHGDPEKALAAYRYVIPRDHLIEAQKRRISNMEKAVKKKPGGSTSSRDTLWREYYRGLITKLNKLQEELEISEDYTPVFFLHRGHAFLLAGRYRESWAVFSSLSEDDSLTPGIRAQAHYLWILTAQNLKRWEEGRQLAEQYELRYPGNPQIAAIQFLTAYSYRETGEYNRAIHLLSEIISRYPKHPGRFLWLFQRGYCHLLNNNHFAAREDFRNYFNADLNDTLKSKARFWHAMSWFYEKRYDKALSELEILQKFANEHDQQMVPEIYYRRASVLYATRDYDNASKKIQEYLALFPGHPREPEARVLRGDILMGRGELIGAAVAFSKVPPEAGPLFVYSVFQSGKIFRALKEHERLIGHFSRYVERSDVSSARKARVAEALYWIGWASNQLGQPERALSVYSKALVEYGNARDEPEIKNILIELEKLHRKISQQGTVIPKGKDPLNLFASEDFNSWLEGAAEYAKEEGKLTYYSRLYLRKADRLQKSGNRAESEYVLLKLLETTPLAYLDGEGLSRLGLLLEAHQFPSAETYLNKILEDFATTPFKGAAYYGLARIHHEKKDPVTARTYLQRFAIEVPGHELKPQAGLLYGKVLTELGLHDQAITEYEKILKLKQARGRFHSEALYGLAQVWDVREEAARSIAYYQRIYTLYPAYSDIAGNAYLESARLFEKIGDLDASLATLREMLTTEAIRTHPRLLEAADRARSIEKKMNLNNENQFDPSPSNPQNKT